jgi:hypothetical protein
MEGGAANVVVGWVGDLWLFDTDKAVRSLPNFLYAPQRLKLSE